MKCKVLFLFTILLLFSCRIDIKTQDSLLQYLPPNPELILKISNLTDFKTEFQNNDFLKKTKEFRLYNVLYHALQELQYVPEATSCLLALYEVGKENYEFVMIAKNQQDFLALDNISNKTIDTLSYQDTNITQYTLNSNELYTVQHDTKIALSSSLILIENIARAKKNNPIERTLQKLYETNVSGESATLFMKATEASMLFSPVKTIENKETQPFSEWISLDFSATSDALTLNGVAMAPDSTKNFINLFRGTSPLAPKTPNYAPLSTEAIVTYTFDDYQIFAQNQNMYLDRVKPVDTLFTTIEEVGIVYLKSQKIVLLHSYGAEGLSDYLEANRSATKMYRGREIIQLQNKTLLTDGFRPLVMDFDANFCVILENTFVFAESKEGLQTLITAYSNTTSFSEVPVYQTAIQPLASASSMLLIADAARIDVLAKHQHIPKLFATNAQTNLSEYAIATQLVSDQGLAHLSLSINKIRKTTTHRAATPLFTLELGANLAMNPQFVKNHRTHEQEIVVQDENHVLYLISTDGKILWKKQLEGSIRGSIQQVDLYKNGRLQLAFCTQHQFLILDRNGKEVLPFNKTFTGVTLNPLAIFDYEGNRNYRFIITQGNKVFMYDNKGKIVKGFTYTQAQSTILTAPKHFRVGSKDYLIFQLADKTLKILHRTGEKRIAVPEKINFSRNGVFLYKNKFSVTNTKGVLHQVDMTGRLTATRFNLYKDHGMDATRNTLVFMNDNILSIKGKKVALELGVYTKPKIFYLYDKIYVSVTDLQNQKIYLFDSQANLLPDFPVFGNSLIDLTDMDNDKTLEFVAKDQDNSLIVYAIE